MSGVHPAFSAFPAAAMACLALLEITAPQDVDPCVCEVVNKYTQTVGTGDCTYLDPGSNRQVPPFTVSGPVYPEGAPAAGRCSAAECGGTNMCTYKPLSVSVTISSCARDCTGHGPSDSGVKVETEYGPQWAHNPSNGQQGFNSNVTYTMTPPTNSSYQMCGSGPFESTITFKKKNGLNALKITFEFGCGKCPAAQ